MRVIKSNVNNVLKNSVDCFWNYKRDKRRQEEAEHPNKRGEINNNKWVTSFVTLILFVIVFNGDITL